MNVLVYYRSGARQIFIVPHDIPTLEFRRIAEAVGGYICKIEFIQKNKLHRHDDTLRNDQFNSVPLPPGNRSDQ